MAGENGDTQADLSARVAAAAGEAEAFQTVRLLLAAARRADASSTGLGGDVGPGDEPVRFHASAGQAFASAEIAAADRKSDADHTDLTVTFMGLTGPSGVLPDHYTERVVRQRRARDPALAEFLDLFNHRAISLFYRAWAKTRLPVRFEEAKEPLSDPFSRALASLIGLGLNAQQEEAALGDGGLLGLAGLLGRRVRTPGAVRRLAAALIDAPVEVEEFHGRWVEIASTERTRLAAPRPGERAFSQLSGEAVAGVTAWDAQSRFRLRIGPLSLTQFHSFFEPDGPRALLTQVVRQAVGPAVGFDLRLVLRRQDVPALRLDDPGAPVRLGQTSWVLGLPASRDRDEAVLSGAG